MHVQHGGRTGVGSQFCWGFVKLYFPVERLHWLPYSLWDCNKVREINRWRQEWKDVFLGGFPLYISPSSFHSLCLFCFPSICAFLWLLTNEFLTVPWFSHLSFPYSLCLQRLAIIQYPSLATVLTLPNSQWCFTVWQQSTQSCGSDTACLTLSSFERQGAVILIRFLISGRTALCARHLLKHMKHRGREAGFGTCV